MNSSIEQIRNGVVNLLVNCAGASPEDRVLLVGENGKEAYFSETLCALVAKIADQMDLTTEIVTAKPVADASQLPTHVSERMQLADITIFFSRLGDQVRFTESPGAGKKIMTYSLTEEYFKSPFAQIAHKSMQAMHDILRENRIIQPVSNYGALWYLFARQNRKAIFPWNVSHHGL